MSVYGAIRTPSGTCRKRKEEEAVNPSYADAAMTSGVDYIHTTARHLSTPRGPCSDAADAGGGN